MREHHVSFLPKGKRDGQRKSFSLRTQILFPCLSLIVITGLLISLFGYYNSRNLAQTDVSKSMEEQVQGLNTSFTTFMKDKEQVVQRMARQDEVINYAADRSKTLQYFKNTGLVDKTILHTYIGQASDGKLLSYPYQKVPKNYDARVRPWYKEIMNGHGKVIITQPYKDMASGKMTVAIGQAFYKEKQLQGVAVIDVTLDTLINQIQDAKTGKNGYAALLDGQGTYLGATIKSLVGKNVSHSDAYLKLKKSGNSGFIDGKVNGEKTLTAFAVNKLTGWTIIGTIDRSQFSQSANSIILPTIILLIVILVIAFAVSFWVARRITGRVYSLKRAIEKMEQGDLTAFVNDTHTDEIGQLSSSVKHMMEINRQTISGITKVSEQVSDASQTLVASVEENTASANEVSSAMSEIAAGASNQSELMEANQKATNTLFEKIHDIQSQTEKIKNIAGNLGAVSTDGSKAVESLRKKSERTSKVTSDIVEAIKELEKRSNDVGKIVGTISDIAGQTNLLALNASIEAARAGENGKGFAVVASEIRKLSDQSDDALKEVSALIGEMHQGTNRAVSLANSTGKALEEQAAVVGDSEVAFHNISQSIGKNNELIDQIGGAVSDMVEETNHIKENIQELTAISEETASGTEEATASIEEQTASMEQLSKLATELGDSANQLHKEVEKYKV